MVTTREAKAIIERELRRLGLPYEKLTARTVDFSGFGYGSSIFVKIHGWQPNPKWDELKQVAKKQGFCIEA